MRLRSSAIAVVGLSVLLSLPLAARAQSRVGPEFRPNSPSGIVLNTPAVAMDADGDFVVVWTSGLVTISLEVTQDGDEHGVFGQRFSRDGLRLGSEFQINTYTTGAQV